MHFSTTLIVPSRNHNTVRSQKHTENKKEPNNRNKSKLNQASTLFFRLRLGPFRKSSSVSSNNDIQQARRTTHHQHNNQSPSTKPAGFSVASVCYRRTNASLKRNKKMTRNRALRSGFLRWAQPYVVEATRTVEKREFPFLLFHIIHV